MEAALELLPQDQFNLVVADLEKKAALGDREAADLLHFIGECNPSQFSRSRTA